MVSNGDSKAKSFHRTHIPVILRSAATKNLRFFASTPFQLSMTYLGLDPLLNEALQCW
jgi:hypothetical protein